MGVGQAEQEARVPLSEGIWGALIEGLLTKVWWTEMEKGNLEWGKAWAPACAGEVREGMSIGAWGPRGLAIARAEPGKEIAAFYLSPVLPASLDSQWGVSMQSQDWPRSALSRGQLCIFIVLWFWDGILDLVAARKVLCCGITLQLCHSLFSWVSPAAPSWRLQPEPQHLCLLFPFAHSGAEVSKGGMELEL